MDFYDFHQLLETRGYPFPYTLASVSLTKGRTGYVAECFVLVDNGKEYFNGQRVALPNDHQPEALATLIPMAERVLQKMYWGSVKRLATRTTIVHPMQAITFDLRSAESASQLIHEGRFEKHLRWVVEKTASPACRSTLLRALELSPKMAALQAASSHYRVGVKRL